MSRERQRMNEWILRQSWEGHSRNRERASLREDALFWRLSRLLHFIVIIIVVYRRCRTFRRSPHCARREIVIFSREIVKLLFSALRESVFVYAHRVWQIEISFRSLVSPVPAFCGFRDNFSTNFRLFVFSFRNACVSRYASFCESWRPMIRNRDATYVQKAIKISEKREERKHRRAFLLWKEHLKNGDFCCEITNVLSFWWRKCVILLSKNASEDRFLTIRQRFVAPLAKRIDVNVSFEKLRSRSERRTNNVCFSKSVFRKIQKHSVCALFWRRFHRIIVRRDKNKQVVLSYSENPNQFSKFSFQVHLCFIEFSPFVVKLSAECAYRTVRCINLLPNAFVKCEKQKKKQPDSRDEKQ